DIVDAGAPAAEIALRQLHEPEPRDASQQVARLAPYLLAMGEMAGVVVGHGARQLAEREVGLGEQLGDVADLAGERVRVGEPVAVLLEGGSASGGGGGDEDLFGRKADAEPAGDVGELVEPPGMQVERPTAALRARRQDLPARRREE